MMDIREKLKLELPELGQENLEKIISFFDSFFADILKDIEDKPNTIYGNMIPIKEGQVLTVIFREQNGDLKSTKAICRDFKIRDIKTNSLIYHVIAWEQQTKISISDATVAPVRPDAPIEKVKPKQIAAKKAAIKRKK